jgi:hypothetical protein
MEILCYGPVNQEAGQLDLQAVAIDPKGAYPLPNLAAGSGATSGHGGGPDRQRAGGPNNRFEPVE